MGNVAEDPAFLYGLRDVYLNAVLVEAVSVGIYTMLFCYTVSLTLTRPKFRRNHKLLFAALVTLYILIVIHFGVQWFFTRTAYVVNGNTADTIIGYLFGAPLSLTMTSGTASAAATLLADAIIVWRCWVIWSKNWLAISLLLVLYIAEFGMAIYNLIGQAVVFNMDTALTDPSTIFLALSLVTTVLATMQIIFRITRLGYGGGTSRYRNVIEVIVESALLYSITLILFLPLYAQTDFRINFISEYLKRITLGMTGIAPTLMVARVAAGLARTDASWSFPSGLENTTSQSTTALSHERNFSNTSQGVGTAGNLSKFSGYTDLQSIENKA